MTTQVLWFKRDLRLEDHAPLVQAAARGPVLALWLDEPGYWAGEDVSARQRAWSFACVADLDGRLRALGGRLWVLPLDAPEAFARLRSALGPFALWSHEETGSGWTYVRDRAVRRFCREHGIDWHERPSNAVVRRLDSRDRWSAHWDRRMREPPLEVPGAIRFACLPDALAALAVDPAEEAQRASPHLHRAPFAPGRAGGKRALERFLTERLSRYRRGMSSPLTAWEDCSQLSAHFAWGTLSIREAVHAVIEHRRSLLALPREARPPGALEGLKSFEARLHWHCHFIQKLESEPALEFRNLHRSYDGLRNEGELTAFERERLARWAEGTTGWPMVDACMRALATTGWLNFRMRAMLMSVAAYPLWLHWRAPGLHLARLFIDYEPGIHWPQVQMQSGTTGINAVRIYDPIKQSRDHDPEGEFIRRWLPELRALADPYLHEPWLAPVPPRGYPAPLVDVKAASREAAARIHALRRTGQARAEAARVYAEHGSRHPGREGLRRGRPRRRTPTDSAPEQAELF
ncbi:MAG: deoxyribodipyrimidine photo-lyase [Casimicrobiaceae bacterium]|nr:deoxyribodipyrimidine photo-lyase [Casimicrobiaceae bacterium]